MLRCRVIALVLAGLVCVGACSLPNLRGAPIVRFQGEATDPVGDTASVRDPRVRRAADLVYASVRVTDDEVRFSVRFAPGSFDAKTTGADFDLDTDLDSTTGMPGFGMGAEYMVTFDPQPVREATVAHAVTDPDCRTPCRFEPFEHGKIFRFADGMEAVIPRRAFTHFDGRANVRVLAFARFDGGRLTITSDHMPNSPGRFIEVR